MYDEDLVDQTLIISRDEAEAAGLTYYFTGKPCKRGHLDFRFVSSGACKRCVNRNKGRAPKGENVMVVYHVFSARPTVEERQEMMKILTAWSDHALVAARKVIADRAAAVTALDLDLRARAAQRPPQ